MNEFGFDTAEFDEMTEQFARLGVSGEEIAETVLDAVEDIAIAAFRANVPVSAIQNKKHARDYVIVTKSKTAKSGSRYRIIGCGSRSTGNGIDYSEFAYLFYLENGTSKMPAHPFIDKAHRAVTAAVLPKMAEILADELEKRMRT